MVYGLGTNLYWRGAKTSWASDVFPKPDPFESDSNLRAQGPKLASGRFGSRYGTLGSGAQQENPLEVISPKGLVYVANLPLDEKGGKETLSTLVKSMLCNTKYDFDLYRRERSDPVYVWLMARHINDSGVGLSPAQAQEIVLGAFVEWREKGLPPPDLMSFGGSVLCLCSQSPTASRELLLIARYLAAPLCSEHSSTLGQNGLGLPLAQELTLMLSRRVARFYPFCIQVPRPKNAS